MKEVYRFRVGVSTLGSSSGSSLFSSSGGLGSHACLLLNTDLFEYGCEKDNKGYARIKGAGRDSRFDWNKVRNALNGTTYVSPDRLEKAIQNSGQWTGDKYSVRKNNCHDFVYFCLNAIGCPESMIKRNWYCYRNQG